MKNLFKYRDGFVSFIGLILVLGIICFLVLKMLNYYGPKAASDKDRQKMLKGEHVDNHNHKAILDNIKNQVNEINKKTAQREKELESLF